MNKEVHYEGWLIKSPPTKRIWRARWRRRWFTLKQGEIPEQFCLEYYTDRNCRKLKGVIDLDQCEQVDCGLRLENRKQKFQYMFDIKTPRRTYYLAADTEADMRDWVNCICQVCHLHDTKQSNDLQDEKIHIAKSLTTTEQFVPSNETTSTTVNTSGSTQHEASMTKQSSMSSDCLRQSVISSASQSGNDCSYVNTDYSNRETMVCGGNQPLYGKKPSQPAQNMTKATTSSGWKSADTQSRLAVSSQGVVRKIPENLVLSATTLVEGNVEPSPALSTSSGPYIPISECYSGSPKFMTEGGNPSTPLNNLDPKFYDTPRSHNNIGLNLTNDQSYSPKITNCGLQTTSKARSGRSSPTDSESVFTDDDEWTHPLPLRENVDRSTRPSDSSVENESFVFTYSQRFSKFPGDNKDEESSEHAAENMSKVVKRKKNLSLDITNEHEKVLREMPQFSDTENTSPAIGPRDASSCVEESYDIPRSHNLPYYNMSQLFDKVNSPENPVAASTPNLLLDAEPLSATSSNRTLPRPHCYTNAAPTKMEGNVFRYDFIDQSALPPVNRKLKPKVSLEDRPPEELAAKPPLQHNGQGTLTKLTKKLMSTTMNNSGENSPLRPPPSVDRKSKPNAFKAHGFSSSGCTTRRSGIPTSMVIQNESDAYVMETRTLPRQPRGHISSVYSNTVNRAMSLSKPTPPTPTTTQKNEHKLQYFDLDVSNPPAMNRASMSTSNLTATGSKLGLSADPSARVPVKSSVVYNSVDFVKTDAFKKIREERKMGINK
ncbi:protein daughter of sevenless [Episyrphus balteatus]|uniref:protein daughter of sevenless n=1 Tax=Episyrphus balteatus TaxID=286459 RepID=UPI002485993C|nr:protein daughter of sevenless [Episyrphus balteatus]